MAIASDSAARPILAQHQQLHRDVADCGSQGSARQGEIIEANAAFRRSLRFRLPANRNVQVSWNLIDQKTA